MTGASTTRVLIALGGEGPRRLVCFHHAGGGPTAFRSWPRALAGVAEITAVSLPGREVRYGEPFAPTISAAAREISAALAAIDDDRPVILTGHSLGAVVAFETARLLERAACQVAGLIASSHAAPPAIAELQAGRPRRHEMDDRDLVGLLTQMGGVPPQILDSDEWREVYLPIIRADMRLIETYGYLEAAPLACPLLALAGRRDPDTPDSALRAWGRCTAGAFDLRRLDGGHFFMNEREDEFFDAVRDFAVALPVGRGAAVA